MSQTSLQEKQETPRSARKSESPKSQLSQRSQSKWLFGFFMDSSQHDVLHISYDL